MEETQKIAQTYSVGDIRSRRSLWYRLHVYVYDLRNFRTDSAARDRLDSIVDITYLGKPYFNEEEAEILKNTISNSSGSKGGTETLAQKIESTLDERLNRRMKKRVESGDFRVCAAHDLAPIFEAFFDIPPKKLAKQLASLISLRGLRLRDEDDISYILGQTKLQALAAKYSTGNKKKKGR
ncbi:TPA_exp: Uncharacterized protein A8136_4869 [Trichophyton benhamiae CBS 112371]|uniref:Uncharacterized protein n=1 Tax=Arthroderma benhamiae (strain ATCC MYA-4681 / CBS 112371) TaxID=663331 RepID=D4B3J1_ARTBC|nr:uncharacterized protein ARB_03030 [Trichophyton benhamiae CBS 112371]EFE29689.1 hypothetical protein ARB_03030 [Trichophyton benhamiae CBS 112371]DAA72944.1 TPA_exp: Uncharacterized protein A8136_4869 [Trichophyton benhamiae CBS 112371]